MITIEEKLNVFTKLVLGHVQQEFEKKYQEINRENDEKIEEHKTKLQERKERIVEDFISKGKIEKNKLISQANLDKKRKILNKKQEFIERIVDSLYKMAEAFCESPEYEGYLVRMLTEILPRFAHEKSVRVFINERDMKNHIELIVREAEKVGFDKEHIQLLKIQEEIVGGLTVYNDDMTLKVDSTIDAIIEENRHKIGQKLYEALKEAGDLNG